MDWFTNLKAGDRGKTVGLEFQEGLWAEKLAIIAILATLTIIVVSIVWCVKGGQLQTVFTVMSFVLSGVAGKSLRIVTVRLVRAMGLIIEQLSLLWLHSTSRSRRQIDQVAVYRGHSFVAIVFYFRYFLEYIESLTSNLNPVLDLHSGLRSVC